MSRILSKILDKYQENLTQITTISYCNYNDDDSTTDSCSSETNLKTEIFLSSPRRHVSGKTELNYNETDFAHVTSLELFNVDVKWSEVFFILKVMPKLKILNLRNNKTLCNFKDQSAFDTSSDATSRLANLVLSDTDSGTESPRPQEITEIAETVPFLDFTKINIKLPQNKFENLETLILNGTKVNFITVAHLARILPNLNTLHLSENSLSYKETTDLNLLPIAVYSHTNLTTLHLSRNKFNNLLDLAPIGDRIFPNLKNLYLGESQSLSDFPESLPRIKIVQLFLKCFSNLNHLSLSDCPIKEWSTLETLGEIKNLENMSISNLPVLKENNNNNKCHSYFSDEFKAIEVNKRKWYLIVAHLPFLKICNRTFITQDERTDAERFCIRYFAHLYNKSNKTPEMGPCIYRKLVEKHGQLEVLAEVDMKPKDEIFVILEFFENDIDKSSEIIGLSTTCKYKLNINKSFEDITKDLCENYFKISLKKGDFNLWRIVSEYEADKGFEGECYSRVIDLKRTKVNMRKKMYQIKDWEDGDLIRLYC